MKKQRQKWEYLTLFRWRSSSPVEGALDEWKLAYDLVLRDLVGSPRALPKFTLDQVLEYLGNKGWELVSTTPRSGSFINSGFASEELWIFKRPKS